MKLSFTYTIPKCTEPNYLIWTKNPIEILATDEELNKNLDMDNPGFAPRDYRYHPEMQLVNIVNKRNTDGPTDLEMFYAWKIENQINATNSLINQEIMPERKVEENRRMFLEKYSGRELYLVGDDVVMKDLVALTRIGIETLLNGETHSLTYLEDYFRLLSCVDLSTSLYGMPPSYRQFTKLLVMLSSVILGNQSISKDEIKHALGELRFIAISIQNNITIGGLGMHQRYELQNIKPRTEYEVYDYSSSYEQNQPVRISDELTRLGYTVESVMKHNHERPLVYVAPDYSINDSVEPEDDEEVDHRILELITDSEYYQHKLEKLDLSKKKDRNKIIRIRQHIFDINRELDDIERMYGRRIPGRVNPDSRTIRIKRKLKRIGEKIKNFFALNGRAIMKVVGIILPIIASAIGNGIYHRIVDSGEA